MAAIATWLIDQLGSARSRCRVYVMQEDGWTLLPIAFRGEIFYEYEHETLEELITHVGEGITGWVAEHRTSVLAADARLVPFAVQIPDTEDILESMLAVPMTVGEAVQGVIVLSSLGYGAFDEEDQRLLEVLASHAAIAISKREAPPGRARSGGDIGGSPRSFEATHPAPGRSATSCRVRSRPSRR